MSWSTHHLYEESFVALDNAFLRLEAQVSKPKAKRWKSGWVYRYKEQTIHQAIILKLARMVSGVRAAYLLSQNGFVQEQATIQRVLDEIGEDILFLTLAITDDAETQLHQRFLSEFFQEEFEEDIDVIDAPQKRDRVPRKKIRAYIARVEGRLSEQARLDPNPSRAKQVYDTVANAYSGYVHAAAIHTMDMYGGNPEKFHLSGMLGTPRADEYAFDLWNYFYRALMSMAFASKAFGDNECFLDLRKMIKRYEAIELRGRI